jgi:hypothetical protein
MLTAGLVRRLNSMKRLFGTRTRLMGLTGLIALAGFLQSTAGRSYCHSEFRKYFDGLGTAEARVNPVERVLFSVLLTTAKPEPQAVVQQVRAKHL